MARVVIGIAASHAPGITARAEEEPEEIRRRVYGNYEKVREELEKARPDSLLVIANDHVTYMFEIIPQFLIPLGDVFEGPHDYQWLRIPKYKLRFDKEISTKLLERLVARGFDVAFSDNPLLDHATMLPLHFLASDRERAVIKYPTAVLLTNVFKRPVPPLSRGFELGRAVREILEREVGDKRVAVIATGGLSHDPGGPRWGYVDEKFDRWFLDAISRGDVKSILELKPEKVFETGGGSYEILNWTILWGIMGGAKAEVLDYVPAYRIGSAWAIWR